MAALQPAKLRAEVFSHAGNGSGMARSMPDVQSIRPRFGMGPRMVENPQQPVPGKPICAFWPMVGSSLAVVALAAGTLFGLLTQEPDTSAGTAMAKVEITTPPTASRQVASVAPPAATPLDDVDETGSITPRSGVAPTRTAALQLNAPIPAEMSAPARPEIPDELSYNPDDMPMQDVAVFEDAEARTSSRPKTAGSEAGDNNRRTVRLDQSVRLRARPNGKSKILTTLTKGTELTLYGCKSWCEVESQRKRGYVYAKALNR